MQELCTDGELFALIKRRHRVEEQEAKYLLKQVVEAVRYMHVNCIMHRDIKPENILLQYVRDRNYIGSGQNIRFRVGGSERLCKKQPLCGHAFVHGTRARQSRAPRLTGRQLGDRDAGLLTADWASAVLDLLRNGPHEDRTIFKRFR